MPKIKVSAKEFQGSRFDNDQGVKKGSIADKKRDVKQKKKMEQELTKDANKGKKIKKW